MLVSVRLYFLFFSALAHNGTVTVVFVGAAQTQICQDTEFSLSPTAKSNKSEISKKRCLCRS